MKLILFGATGMVGAGVLREAVAAPEVEAVLCIGRRPSGFVHPKVRELVVIDLFDFSAVEGDLVGWDACIWAVGISSIGLGEAAYAQVTEELTLLWARALLRLNPDSSFCYCSAAGAGGGSMWARVRQRVEKGLSTLPFRHVGVVRPAFIRPGPGIWSQVKLYNVAIALMSPIAPLLVRAFPFACTSSERLGRAMLRVVAGRADRFILESIDINRVGAYGTHMTAEGKQQYWFKAKTYGWGWGLPSAWQGWVVLVTFMVLAIGGPLVVIGDFHVGLYILWVASLSSVVFAICWIKGEPPRWR